jgi:AcrR family transcriptional regulator
MCQEPMTPRPYRMARRRQSTEATRSRILSAARDLIAGDPGTFSMEEVARQARVARMTVYYQFGSLPGLLEALCDSLAIAGGMNYLAEAFQLSDFDAAIDRFIESFTRFWESDRSVLRGLGALAALQPKLGMVLEQRYDWRRKGIGVLLERHAKQTRRRKPKEMREAADLLYLLTSFATYDTLAGSDRTRGEVTALLQKAARRLLE